MDPRLSAAATVSRLRWQTLAVFLFATAAYFLARTPALDEWDSVQFAQGVTDFNLWRHHPHPPGYPLYIAAGWLFSHALPLDIPTALQLASALGGGLFVACWFALAAQTFGRFVGACGAVSLGTLLITWMTATKALTDAPGAGLLALTLLLVRNRRPLPAAAVAALAVGTRPQTFPVLLLIVILALAATPPPRRWATTLGTFFLSCLLWLWPTVILQARTPESGGNILAYPTQLLAQWRWRFDQPRAFVGADTHGQSFLLYRLDHHVLGLLTRGFGFPLGSVWGWLGVGALGLGWTFYVIAVRRSARLAAGGPRPPGAVASLAAQPPDSFWKTHFPWAALYVAIVFCCLPGDQRYYLPIQPLLLLPALVGWSTIIPTPRGRFLALLLPAATSLATRPFVVENHREPAPPVRMLRYLQSQYPPAERPGVHLLLRDSFRHAQWYAPDFPLGNAADHPSTDDLLTASPPPILYTDDPDAGRIGNRPGEWQPVVRFDRSPLIYRKHSEVTLYRWTDLPRSGSNPR